MALLQEPVAVPSRRTGVRVAGQWLRAMRIATCAVLFNVCAGSAIAAEADVRSLTEAGHWKQVRAVLEPTVKADPEDAGAAAQLSRVRVAFGDLEGAIALAETAVRLNGSVAEYHWLLARACGEQARHAGLVRQFGLAKRFRQEAEKAIALDPKHIQSRLYLISYYAGAPSVAGGDRKMAERIADEVASIDAAWGHLARARIVYETRSATDPESVAERASLYGKALDAARTPDARYEALTALVSLHLSSPAQDFDLAERYAREALSGDPHRAGPYVGLAIAHASRGKWTELDATLVEAEKAVPDNLAPFYQAGRVILVQGGEYPRAERYFRKFLTQEPEAGAATLAHAHWRLGMVLDKQGRRLEAINEMEQVLRLEPDLDEARKELRRLRGA